MQQLDPLPICDQRTITTTKQTIYFLRHGVALHNLPIIIHNPTKTTYRNANLHDPKYTDSKLVLPKGYQQSKLAGRRLLNDLLYYSYDKNGKNIINHNNDNDDKKNKLLDYVFVSPLSRCFETAYFVMEEIERGINNQNTNTNTTNTEYKIDNNIPWICKEDLREAYGIHYSDKRSCRSFLEVSLYNTKCTILYYFHSHHSLKLIIYSFYYIVCFILL